MSVQRKINRLTVGNPSGDIRVNVPDYKLNDHVAYNRVENGKLKASRAFISDISMPEVKVEPQYMRGLDFRNYEWVVNKFFNDVSVLDFNKELNESLQDRYIMALGDNLNLMFNNAPSYFMKTIKPNISLYQVYIFVLYFIIRVHNEVETKEFDPYRNWVEQQWHPDLEFMLKGPDDNQNITNDFKTHYYSIVKPTYDLDTIISGNQLSQQKKMSFLLHNQIEYMKHRPNSYDKLRDKNRKTVLMLNTDSRTRIDTDERGYLVFDFGGYSFRNGINNADAANAYTQFKELMQHYGTITIQSMMIDADMFEQPLDSYRELYVVFEGIIPNMRTINNRYDFPYLYFPGRFEPRNGGVYDFVPNVESITYESDQVQIKNIRLYITSTLDKTGRNKVSVINPTLSLSMNNSFNIAYLNQLQLTSSNVVSLKNLPIYYRLPTYTNDELITMAGIPYIETSAVDPGRTLMLAKYYDLNAGSENDILKVLTATLKPTTSDKAEVTYDEGMSGFYNMMWCNYNVWLKAAPTEGKMQNYNAVSSSIVSVNAMVKVINSSMYSCNVKTYESTRSDAVIVITIDSGKSTYTRDITFDETGTYPSCKYDESRRVCIYKYKPTYCKETLYEYYNNLKVATYVYQKVYVEQEIGSISSAHCYDQYHYYDPDTKTEYFVYEPLTYVSYNKRTNAINVLGEGVQSAMYVYSGTGTDLSNMDTYQLEVFDKGFVYATNSSFTQMITVGNDVYPVISAIGYNASGNNTVTFDVDSDGKITVGNSDTATDTFTVNNEGEITVKCKSYNASECGGTLDDSTSPATLTFETTNVTTALYDNEHRQLIDDPNSDAAYYKYNSAYYVRYDIEDGKYIIKDNKIYSTSDNSMYTYKYDISNDDVKFYVVRINGQDYQVAIDNTIKFNNDATYTLENNKIEFAVTDGNITVGGNEYAARQFGVYEDGKVTFAVIDSKITIGSKEYTGVSANNKYGGKYISGTLTFDVNDGKITVNGKSYTALECGGILDNSTSPTKVTFSVIDGNITVGDDVYEDVTVNNKYGGEYNNAAVVFTANSNSEITVNGTKYTNVSADNNYGGTYVDGTLTFTVDTNDNFIVGGTTHNALECDGEYDQTDHVIKFLVDDGKINVCGVIYAASAFNNSYYIYLPDGNGTRNLYLMVETDSEGNFTVGDTKHTILDTNGTYDATTNTVTFNIDDNGTVTIDGAIYKIIQDTTYGVYGWDGEQETLKLITDDNGNITIKGNVYTDVSADNTYGGEYVNATLTFDVNDGKITVGDDNTYIATECGGEYNTTAKTVTFDVIDGNVIIGSNEYTDVSTANIYGGGYSTTTKALAFAVNNGKITIGVDTYDAKTFGTYDRDAKIVTYVMSYNSTSIGKSVMIGSKYTVENPFVRIGTIKVGNDVYPVNSTIGSEYNTIYNTVTFDVVDGKITVNGKSYTTLECGGTPDDSTNPTKVTFTVINGKTYDVADNKVSIDNYKHGTTFNVETDGKIHIGTKSYAVDYSKIKIGDTVYSISNGSINYNGVSKTLNSGTIEINGKPYYAGVISVDGYDYGLTSATELTFETIVGKITFNDTTYDVSASSSEYSYDTANNTVTFTVDSDGYITFNGTKYPVPVTNNYGGTYADGTLTFDVDNYIKIGNTEYQVSGTTATINYEYDVNSSYKVVIPAVIMVGNVSHDISNNTITINNVSYEVKNGSAIVTPTFSWTCNNDTYDIDYTKIKIGGNTYVISNDNTVTIDGTPHTVENGTITINSVPYYVGVYTEGSETKGVENNTNLTAYIGDEPYEVTDGKITINSVDYTIVDGKVTFDKYFKVGNNLFPTTGDTVTFDVMVNVNNNDYILTADTISNGTTTYNIDKTVGDYTIVGTKLVKETTITNMNFANSLSAPGVTPTVEVKETTDSAYDGYTDVVNVNAKMVAINSSIYYANYDDAGWNKCSYEDFERYNELGPTIVSYPITFSNTYTDPAYGFILNSRDFKPVITNSITFGEGKSSAVYKDVNIYDLNDDTHYETYRVVGNIMYRIETDLNAETASGCYFIDNVYGDRVFFSLNSAPLYEAQPTSGNSSSSDSKNNYIRLCANNHLTYETDMRGLGLTLFKQYIEDVNMYASITSSFPYEEWDKVYTEYHQLLQSIPIAQQLHNIGEMVLSTDTIDLNTGLSNGKYVAIDPEYLLVNETNALRVDSVYTSNPLMSIRGATLDDEYICAGFYDPKATIFQFTDGFIENAPNFRFTLNDPTIDETFVYTSDGHIYDTLSKRLLYNANNAPPETMIHKGFGLPMLYNYEYEDYCIITDDCFNIKFKYVNNRITSNITVCFFNSSQWIISPDCSTIVKPTIMDSTLQSGVAIAIYPTTNDSVVKYGYNNYVYTLTLSNGSLIKSSTPESTVTTNSKITEVEGVQGTLKTTITTSVVGNSYVTTKLYTFIPDTPQDAGNIDDYTKLEGHSIYVKSETTSKAIESSKELLTITNGTFAVPAGHDIYVKDYTSTVNTNSYAYRAYKVDLTGKLVNYKSMIDSILMIKLRSLGDIALTMTDIVTLPRTWQAFNGNTRILGDIQFNNKSIYVNYNEYDEIVVRNTEILSNNLSFNTIINDSKVIEFHCGDSITYARMTISIDSNNFISGIEVGLVDFYNSQVVTIYKISGTTIPSGVWVRDQDVSYILTYYPSTNGVFLVSVALSVRYDDYELLYKNDAGYVYRKPYACFGYSNRDSWVISDDIVYNVEPYNRTSYVYKSVNYYMNVMMDPKIDEVMFLYPNNGIPNELVYLNNSAQEGNSGMLPINVNKTYPIMSVNDNLILISGINRDSPIFEQNVIDISSITAVPEESKISMKLEFT